MPNSFVPHFTVYLSKKGRALLRNRIFTPTLMCLALSAAFSGSLYAAEAPACSAPNADKRFLKIERATSSGLPVPPESATRLTADRIDGVAARQADAQGSVIVERDAQVLNAEKIHYNEADNQILSEGQFILSDDASNISGEKLDYNIATEHGSALRANFDNVKGKQRYQGTAEKMEMLGKGYYRLSDAELNTCEPNDDSWYIKAKTIDTDESKNIGVAKHARLVFKGVPILYSPWLDFPLNGNRKSGFLAPTVGGGSDGFELAIPYYLNLAPNYDATITPHFYSRRGLAWFGELRYLKEKYRGQVWGQWLPNDRLTGGKNRRSFHWQHTQTLAPKVRMGIDYHLASDDDYYRDLGNRLDAAENVNLNRQLWLTYNDSLWGGSWSNRLNFQRYQTLQNEKENLIEPYRLLPQYTSTWNKNFGKARVSVLAQITRFEHPTRQEGSRQVLYPSVRWDFSKSWGFIRPKIGVHATTYQLDAWRNQPKNNVSRVLPIVSVDGGLIFERNMKFFGKGMIQTLEPRLFYVYIPTRSQNKLPNFDSSQNDFTYDQLFRENRFSGQDRINAANQVSTALMTRFYEDNTGIERFRAGIGQRFYLKNDDVDLSGSVRTRSKNRSDLIAFAGGNITNSIYWQNDWHYDQNEKRSQSYSTALRYHPAPGKTFSVRFGFDRNSTWYTGYTGKLKYLDVGVQWPIYRGYSVIARQNYSLTDKKALDQLIGINYRADCGCWNANLVFQRYVTDYNTTKNAVFFQLQLKGLGGLGTTANEELRRAIPGYSSIYEVK
ncbi:MAG: LPS-assembly protein LptD [Neisseria sp.]|nr:LPS-assembly protein LptD [Neisseria sp.]